VGALAPGAPSGREDSVRPPQHADEHHPQRPVLLAVDQQLGERPRLGVAVELADPVGSLEVGEHEDVEQLGPWSGTESFEPIA